jgi:enoyl-[acyl-carrier protein] reductase II
MAVRTDVLRTRICDMLDIEFPVVSAGMGFVARAELAAAVSNAGGLGVIGGAGFTPQRLRDEINRCREMTDKPFGVDLILPAQTTGQPSRERVKADPNLQGEFAVDEDGFLVRPEDLMDVVVDEAPHVFASGLGNPGPWVADMHARGMKVISLVGNVRNALKVDDSGVDIVCAQGTEAGGHTGRVAAMALVPAIADAVKPKPVLAAGGICDGRGLAAALCLGASGVWMGSRFVATLEATAHENYKSKIVDAHEDSTIITRSYSGKPLRVIRNKWTDDWERRPQDILPFPQQFRNSGAIYVSARRDGDTDIGSMPCGQGAHAIHELLPAAEVVRRVIEEAREVLSNKIYER